jgi:hypothetical protein
VDVDAMGNNENIPLSTIVLITPLFSLSIT